MEALGGKNLLTMVGLVGIFTNGGGFGKIASGGLS